MKLLGKARFVHSNSPFFDLTTLLVPHELAHRQSFQVATWTSTDDVRPASPVFADRTTPRSEAGSTWRCEARRKTSSLQVRPGQREHETTRVEAGGGGGGVFFGFRLYVFWLAPQCRRLVTWCPWIQTACQTRTWNWNWFPTRRATANRRPRPSAPHSIQSGTRVLPCESEPAWMWRERVWGRHVKI